jgi:hypothetical protein
VTALLAGLVGLALPDFDKETLMLAALWAMIVAGAVVALGALVLFRRERALHRMPMPSTGEAPRAEAP